MKTARRQAPIQLTGSQFTIPIVNGTSSPARRKSAGFLLHKKSIVHQVVRCDSLDEILNHDFSSSLGIGLSPVILCLVPGASSCLRLYARQRLSSARVSLNIAAGVSTS